MVIKRKRAESLAEIGQSMGIKFSICVPAENGVEEIICPVKCRDFLGDVYSSCIQETKFSIYGMSWDGTKDKVPTDKLRLSLYFPSAQAKVNFEKNIRFLHEIEDKNSFERSNYISLDGNTGYIEGDARWLNFSILSFTLYTLLIRVFCYELEEDWIAEMAASSYSDGNYIRNFDRESLHKVLDNLSLLEMPEWCGLNYAEHGISGVHHNSGIVSVMSTHSEINPATVRKNKHYLIIKDRGLKTYV